jgi:hypothetical protein
MTEARSNTEGMTDNRGLRQTVFWLTLVLFPAAILGCAEFGLRVAGYTYGYPLFVPVDQHRDFAFVSPDLGRRYFSGPNPPTVLAEMNAAMSLS